MFAGDHSRWSHGATTCGTASNIPKIPWEAALKEDAAITLELQLPPEKAKKTPGGSWEESQAATGYGSSSKIHETPRGATRSWGLLHRIFPPSSGGKKKLGDAWEESRGVTRHGPASYISKAMKASYQDVSKAKCLSFRRAGGGFNLTEQEDDGGTRTAVYDVNHRSSQPEWPAKAHREG